MVLEGAILRLHSHMIDILIEAHKLLHELLVTLLKRHYYSFVTFLFVPLICR